MQGEAFKTPVMEGTEEKLEVSAVTKAEAEAVLVMELAAVALSLIHI